MSLSSPSLTTRMTLRPGRSRRSRRVISIDRKIAVPPEAVPIRFRVFSGSPGSPVKSCSTVSWSLNFATMISSPGRREDSSAPAASRTFLT